VLLDVSGMMCGGCAARVRSVLAADARVENVAVNLLAESAAVRLRSPAPGAGEELAARLTQCGFPSEARRGGAAAGATESARKWREMAARKSELLARSRGRVAFAWTLVALCCGSHATHLLHSVGIHIAHGEFRLSQEPDLKLWTRKRSSNWMCFFFNLKLHSPPMLMLTWPLWE
jgi:Cu2+-exporting ATPase